MLYAAMKNYAAATVDEYIISMNNEAKPILNELRTLVLAGLPEATEKIAWGIPFYRLGGVQVGFAAFKKHVSFGLAFAFSEEDRLYFEGHGYTTGSKTVQIKFDQKVPAAQIKKILKERIRLDEMKKNLK